MLRVLLLVGLLGAGEQLVDLARQLGFRLQHALEAHRLVLARVRLELRAVERDVAQLHQAGLLAELQHRQVELLERFAMGATKLRNDGVIGMCTGGDHAEGDVRMCRGLDLP